MSAFAIRCFLNQVPEPDVLVKELTGQTLASIPGGYDFARVPFRKMGMQGQSFQTCRTHLACRGREG